MRIASYEANPHSYEQRRHVVSPSTTRIPLGIAATMLIGSVWNGFRGRNQVNSVYGGRLSGMRQAMRPSPNRLERSIWGIRLAATFCCKFGTRVLCEKKRSQQRTWRANTRFAPYESLVPHCGD